MSNQTKALVIKKGDHNNRLPNQKILIVIYQLLHAWYVDHQGASRKIFQPCLSNL
jgi:hypothetical protein